MHLRNVVLPDPDGPSSTTTSPRRTSMSMPLSTSLPWNALVTLMACTRGTASVVGAVAVVSGKISGETETLPLLVENEYTNFNVAGAYAAAIVLAILAVLILLSMNLLRRRSPGGEDEAGLQVVAEPAKEA